MSIHEVIMGKDGQEVDRRPFSGVNRRMLRVWVEKGERKFFPGPIRTKEAITAFETIRKIETIGGKIVGEVVFLRDQIKPEDFCIPQSIGDRLTGHRKRLEYVNDTPELDD